MAQKKLPPAVLAQINKYIKVLKADRLPIDGVYVFGSFAKGRPRQWSDIDVCIVSQRFSDAWQALRYLAHKVPWSTDPVEPHIEAVGFHPRDFQDGSTLINEIKKTGIKIKV